MTISKFFTPALTFLLVLGGVVPVQASVLEVSSQKKNSLHQLVQDHQEDQIVQENQLVQENQENLVQPSLEIAHRRFGRRSFRRGGFRRGRSFRRGGFRRGRNFRRGGFRRARNFRRGNFRRGNFRSGNFRDGDFRGGDFRDGDFVIRRGIR